MGAAVELPKIVVGGFPNSGTSFLVWLIVEMGFSPGPIGQLKKADDHNRWGYWEHLNMKRLIWYATKYRAKYHPFRAKKLQALPLDNHPVIPKMRRLARQDNIEVYKETGLPVLYRLFPRESKYIVISRNPKEVYRSGGYARRRIAPDRFGQIFEDYYRLVQKMDVPYLMVKYEDFGRDFAATARAVADHLDVTLDVKKLRKVWRPRE